MKMQCTMWMLVVGAGAVAMLGPQAKAAPLPFTHAYEADYLPQDPLSNPQWDRYFGGPNTSESVAGGILTVFTASNGEALEYRVEGGAGQAWNPTGTGTTVEMRLKTDFNTAGSDWAGTVLVGTGSRFWALGIGARYISDFASGGDLRIDTDDAFHTYRLVVGDELNGPLELYVDGGLSPAKTWAGAASGANRVAFGDLTGNESGQVQWDYLRWTNDGAIIPEPSVLSLAALACVGILRARPGRRMKDIV